MNLTRNKTILIIGGTGHFGGRICRRLLGEPNSHLVVTSRSLSSATRLVDELKLLDPQQPIGAAALDQTSDYFERELEAIDPDIVVHTAGPYQGQNFRVAKACVAIGCHYVDLADARAFVSEFKQLDAQAKNANVLLVSGASTLPGLSSAVLDHFAVDFQTIDSLQSSIAPAHQTPRGISTISAVLSYCGKPFQVLENGARVTRFGWQNLKWQRYPNLGRRLSAACDVPDLSVLPNYLTTLKTVTFHAALEAPWEQFSLWTMAWVTRLRLLKSWSKLVPFFNFVSEKTIRLGSAKGGMHVRLSGAGLDGSEKRITWYLLAEKNHGPEIPCTPIILLVRKLARDQVSERGATACVGLISLEEYYKEFESFEISWQTQ